MPTLYTENAEKWKALADIDYFTHFVKAWIPFNAWYRTYYPELTRDRDAIDEIKSSANKFRDRLVALLVGTDNDSKVFRTHVSALHYELERTYIYNKGMRMCFGQIVLGRNPDKIWTHEYSGISYRVERGPGGRSETEIEITVLNTAGMAILSHTQTDGFDLEKFKAHPGFLKLSATQQRWLEYCYKQIDPFKPTNLLASDEDDCIEMGSYRFVNDTDRLCRGIIEILYQMRNGLFHGTIIPDNETRKIYEPAYHILKMLLQAL